MRALHVPQAGGQPVLGELPIPEVARGHVLIKVEAAGLNPLDNAIAAGLMAKRFWHEYPLVLGRDAAGVVQAVGEGVDHVEPGQEVFGDVILTSPIQAGTLAEYALLPASTVAVKPAGLDFATAAALPLASAAASAAVDHVDPEPGQTVLGNGATGGVGRYAVQLLAARGVRVVATGTAADAERLVALGARTVVDHTAGSIVERVRAAHPDGVDALVNLVGNTPADVPLDAVRKGGKVAATVMAPDADTLDAAGLTGGMVYAQPVREITEPLAEQAAAGTLAVDVHTVLPLEQAADGLAVLAAGQARGKIVVLFERRPPSRRS
ncbi:NADP-dependent oxidoreductase [Streptomyces sp. NPDC046862]|uniref:NADP-dependent oxidoreductase n=1 Tax=Streptomyces sp. NPDC046862 TaxID=3154603 RepID=UPI003452FA37